MLLIDAVDCFCCCCCELWGTWCGAHSTVVSHRKEQTGTFCIVGGGGPVYSKSLMLLAAALGPSIPRSFAAAVDPVFVYCWVPVCRERERERTEQKARVGCVPKASHREREREIVLIRGGASSLCALRRGRKATAAAAAAAAAGMMCYETKS